MKAFIKRIGNQRGGALIMCIVLLVILVITSVVVLMAAVATDGLTHTDRDVTGSTYLARSAADLVRAEITDQHRRLDELRRQAEFYHIPLSRANPIYEADWIADKTARLRDIENETRDIFAYIRDWMVPDDGMHPYLHQVAIDGNIVDVSVQRIGDEIVITSRAEIDGSVGFAQLSFTVSENVIEDD